MPDLSGAEFIFHFTQEGTDDGFEIIFPDGDAAEIFFLLADRGKISTHHISEVADKITGHYGIQVYDAKPFVVFIEQYVADLGVMVRHPDLKARMMPDLFELLLYIFECPDGSY